MQRLWSIPLLLIALGVVACSNPGRKVETVDIEERVWGSPEEFYFDNSDSLKRCQIALTLRYDYEHIADSVALDIRCISPDSLVFEEPFTIYPPRLCLSRPAEHTFVYRRDVVLQRKGRYTFRLTPHKPTEGVWSVGVIVDNTMYN